MRNLHIEEDVCGAPAALSEENVYAIYRAARDGMFYKGKFETVNLADATYIKRILKK